MKANNKYANVPRRSRKTTWADTAENSGAVCRKVQAYEVLIVGTNDKEKAWHSEPMTKHDTINILRQKYEETRNYLLKDEKPSALMDFDELSDDQFMLKVCGKDPAYMGKVLPCRDVTVYERVVPVYFVATGTGASMDMDLSVPCLELADAQHMLRKCYREDYKQIKKECGTDAAELDINSCTDTSYSLLCERIDAEYVGAIQTVYISRDTAQQILEQFKQEEGKC